MAVDDRHAFGPLIHSWAPLSVVVGRADPGRCGDLSAGVRDLFVYESNNSVTNGAVKNV